MQTKDEWRFVVMEYGELLDLAAGTVLMLELFAGNCILHTPVCIHILLWPVQWVIWYMHI